MVSKQKKMSKETDRGSISLNGKGSVLVISIICSWNINFIYK